jgi:hypothetical protein
MEILGVVKRLSLSTFISLSQSAAILVYTGIAAVVFSFICKSQSMIDGGRKKGKESRGSE